MLVTWILSNNCWCIQIHFKNQELDQFSNEPNDRFKSVKSWDSEKFLKAGTLSIKNKPNFSAIKFWEYIRVVLDALKSTDDLPVEDTTWNDKGAGLDLKLDVLAFSWS